MNNNLGDHQLEAGQIAVWAIHKQTPNVMFDAMNCLPLQEREHAETLRQKDQALWWSYVRHSVRDILSEYCALTPAEIQFSLSEFGKPKLSWPANSGIQFNLSHARDLALLAVSYGKDLGIDVEELRAMQDMDMVAARFFSPQENQLVLSAPTENKAEIFFSIWTKKEALIKAHGHGLAIELNSFCTKDVGGTWHSIMFDETWYHMIDLNIPAQMSENIEMAQHKSALCFKTQLENTDHNKPTAMPSIRHIAYD